MTATAGTATIYPPSEYAPRERLTRRQRLALLVQAALERCPELDDWADLQEVVLTVRFAGGGRPQRVHLALHGGREL